MRQKQLPRATSTRCFDALRVPILAHITVQSKIRAGERIRTVDNNVGNVVLYQLSYTRKRKTEIPLRIQSPHLGKHQFSE